MHFCQQWRKACMSLSEKSATVDVNHCHCCHYQNAPPTTSLCSHPLLGLHKRSATVNECQWVPFFPHAEIQRPIFASYTLPCQMPFGQTAPLLPSVAQQQCVTEHWGKGWTFTSIPSTSTSDIMGWDNKTGSIASRAALAFPLFQPSIHDISTINSTKTQQICFYSFKTLLHTHTYQSS